MTDEAGLSCYPWLPVVGRTVSLRRAAHSRPPNVDYAWGAPPEAPTRCLSGPRVASISLRRPATLPRRPPAPSSIFSTIAILALVGGSRAGRVQDRRGRGSGRTVAPYDWLKAVVERALSVASLDWRRRALRSAIPLKDQQGLTVPASDVWHRCPAACRSASGHCAREEAMMKLV